MFIHSPAVLLFNICFKWRLARAPWFHPLGQDQQWNHQVIHHSPTHPPNFFQHLPIPPQPTPAQPLISTHHNGHQVEVDGRGVFLQVGNSSVKEEICTSPWNMSHIATITMKRVTYSHHHYETWHIQPPLLKHVTYSHHHDETRHIQPPSLKHVTYSHHHNETCHIQPPSQSNMSHTATITVEHVTYSHHH